MTLTPFSYDLPRERIAQRPVHPYDSAKLLVVEREEGVLRDSLFSDLHTFLDQGDLLLLNNTKVYPARLCGVRSETGGSVELLLLEQLSDETWLCLGKPLKKLRNGTSLAFGCGLLAQVRERIDEQRVSVSFSVEGGPSLLPERMREVGVMPIPPYIRDGQADAQDKQDYQTSFAAVEGSVAAPTASLHFTPSLFDSLDQNGIERETLTLHVGTASFLPLQRDDGSLEFLPPGQELLSVPHSLCEKVIKFRSQAKKVIPVGTTAMRALESAMRGCLDGATDLFITPGFEFLGADGLITNFHQPGTTHLLLVEALLGRELLEEVYAHALENEYRFLSYGDGMLIL